MNKKTPVIVAAAAAVMAAGVAACEQRGTLSLLIARASGGPAQRDRPIDPATTRTVVDALITALNAHYVFPDKARALAERLRERLPHYTATTSAEALAEVLTADMRALLHDRHLRVEYSDRVVPPDVTEAADDTLSPQDRAEMQRLNYGFEQVQRLPFNIGYLELTVLSPEADDRLAAAMTLLGDTQALIIDLRGCRGGAPHSVAAVASYLVERRTHLSDFVDRDGRVTEEVHTSEQVTGPRYGAQRPLYILTSHDTFSAAEDFSYAMKNLKRATLVGEATGGGAHPGELRRLGDHFAAFIPSGRSLSPITQTNWEGVGVEPDLKVAADDALNAAQSQILKARLASEPDEAVKLRIAARIADLD